MYICSILHSMSSICTSKPTVKSSILMLIQNFWDIYIVVYMQSKIRFWNKFAFFAYPATMVTAPEKMAQCSIVACFALRGTYWLVVFPAKERSWKFQRNSRSVRGEPIYPEDASWVWDNVVPREETFRPSQPPPITTDCPFFHFAAETNGWFHKIFEGGVLSNFNRHSDLTLTCMHSLKYSCPLVIRPTSEQYCSRNGEKK